MAELVLGTGHQKSAYDVIAIVDQQIRKVQGNPRKIVVRATTAEITAERADFDGEFTTFTLRLKLSPDKLASLRGVAEHYGEACALSTEDGWHVFKCQSASDNGVQTKDVVGALSGPLTLPEVWRAKGDRFRVDRISAELMFQAMVQYRASDIHLSPGEPPVFRIDNQTRRSELIGIVSSAQIYSFLREIASDREWNTFQEDQQCSFSFHQVGIGYSRVSAFMKSGAPHCTLRFLPEKIPSFEELSIPGKTMAELANLHHGLLLVTGMTGSGKSTTVAALVDWINSNKALHILTIENPIEYVHQNKKSVVSQRNLGTDVATFNLAVTGALRHDPDVIVIGEMRDPDTIRSAINAAATGHLVISTLHANTASEVVNRIVSFFDPVERDLVRLQLRDCLKCVICQRLVPKMGGGRVPALEMMFSDIKPIVDGVVAGDTDAIRVGMQQTVSHSFLFEDYLLRLHKEKKVDMEVAREYASEPSIFDQMLMGTYSVPRLDSLKAAREAGRA